jgi:hypothetical protein
MLSFAAKKSVAVTLLIFVAVFETKWLTKFPLHNMKRTVLSTEKLSKNSITNSKTYLIEASHIATAQIKSSFSQLLNLCL